MNEEHEGWGGKFGDKYTKRNPKLSDFHYTNGKTRLELTKDFLDKLPRDISILELGCNRGNATRIIHDMGFTNITGIDINVNAIIQIEKDFPEYIFIHSSIEDYPPTKKFDLVYTSGLLIHIHPNNIESTINKMKTLARK